MASGTWWPPGSDVCPPSSLVPAHAYLHFTANPEVTVHTYQFVGPAFYVVGVEFPKRYI